MKKTMALVLTLVLALGLATTALAADMVTTAAPAPTVMTHAEYDAAELDSAVTVETYVQAKQDWWDNKGTFYTQAKDGAYFIYELPCTQEEYNALVPGTKIRVSGTKTAWAGEVEIVDATYEIIPDDTWVAPAADVTALVGTDELIKHQNEKVTFKGMTIVGYVNAGEGQDGTNAISYQNGAPGKDIYFQAKAPNGGTVSFCVESYLTGPDTALYTTDIPALKIGDVVDIETYLYWYEGANPHVTGVKAAAGAPDAGAQAPAEQQPTDTAPKTGDNSAFWMTVLVLSALGLVLLLRKKDVTE